MNNSIGIIREFWTKNFHVIVDAIPDNDTDLSFDETGETARKIDNGDYIAFTARVRVFFRDSEIGSDYLSGCIYESLDAFQDHKECGKQNAEYKRKGIAGRCGSYFHSMINEACAEARNTLRKAQAIRVR